MEKERIIAWLDRITEFSLCALIFTLPFSKSMVEIFFTSALVCWIVKRSILKTFRPVRTKLDLPIYVFVFLGFLSMLTSISFTLSLEGFFFKLFEWIMIYFIVVETINSKKRLNRILLVLISSMVLLGIDGIFQYVTGIEFIRRYPLHGPSIGVSFNNPNGFAGWLMVMVPLALCLAYFGKNNWFGLPGKYNRLKKAIGPLLWILTGILIFCLAFTRTRGAWVGGFLSLIFIGIFKDKKLLIVAIAAMLVLPFVVPDSIKESASSLLSSEDRNVSVRIDLWREASSIIGDFPLLGSGLNTYATVALRYKSTEETGSYPHNSYLHMAAESGLLGLGAFLWIIITLFKTSLANLRRIDDRFYSAPLIGLLAGLLGFLTHSFVDTNIYMLQLGNLMWFTIGLIIAVQKVSLQNREALKNEIAKN